MKIDQRQITYEFHDDDGAFDIEAWLGGVRIGYARCVPKGERLTLGDIHVEEEIPRRWPILHNLLHFFVGKRCPWRTRRLGIGNQLLTRLLQKADASGFQEICGSIMPADIQAWPGLLDWYRRHGFVATEPDEQCLRGAVKKIVRRKQAASNTIPHGFSTLPFCLS
jgi:hypothetical protein